MVWTCLFFQSRVSGFLQPRPKCVEMCVIRTLTRVCLSFAGKTKGTKLERGVAFDLPNGSLAFQNCSVCMRRCVFKLFASCIKCKLRLGLFSRWRHSFRFRLHIKKLKTLNLQLLYSNGQRRGKEEESGDLWLASDSTIYVLQHKVDGRSYSEQEIVLVWQTQAYTYVPCVRLWKESQTTQC